MFYSTFRTFRTVLTYLAWLWLAAWLRGVFEGNDVVFKGRAVNEYLASIQSSYLYLATPQDFMF